MEKVMLPPTAEEHVLTTVPVAVTAGVKDAAYDTPAVYKVITKAATANNPIFFIICCLQDGVSLLKGYDRPSHMEPNINK
jgi:hypothetical protein